MRISEEKSDSSKVLLVGPAELLLARSSFLAPASHWLLLAPEDPWMDRGVVFGVGPVRRLLAPKRLGFDRVSGDKTTDVLRVADLGCLVPSSP
jgi:hypothetical protein